MIKNTIIIEASQALDRQRRGIGVQMRSWLEAAPFEHFAETQFVVAFRDLGDEVDQLIIKAPNVHVIAKRAVDEATYIDHLYELEPDLIFFPLASRHYYRRHAAKVVGVDYGMEDLYCRNYIAPQPVSDLIDGHAFAMQNFDGIVTVSETSRRDLGWFFPEYRHKLEVVYPGYASGPREDETVRLPAGLAGQYYFLVVGYEHKKNISRLATAFDWFKQQTGSGTKLVIVGKPGYGADQIDKYIDGLQCAGDILRLGYVTEAQKQQLLSQCHAVVALAIYEGFGISALEGLLFEKPVLVSDNGSLKEVVGDAGYVADPFVVESIARQLKLMDGIVANPKQSRIRQQLARFDQAEQSAKLLRYLVGLI